jgi:hypothetical protein
MSTEHQLEQKSEFVETLQERQQSAALATKENEKRCDECGCRVTVDPRNGREYGHRRGHRGQRSRCSQRPTVLDQDDPNTGPHLLEE